MQRPLQRHHPEVGLGSLSPRSRGPHLDATGTASDGQGRLLQLANVDFRRHHILRAWSPMLVNTAYNGLRHTDLVLLRLIMNGTSVLLNR